MTVLRAVTDEAKELTTSKIRKDPTVATLSDGRVPAAVRSATWSHGFGRWLTHR